MTELAFIDVETGGLNPDIHPLIEVAVIQWPEEELIHFSLPYLITACTPEAIKVAKLAERNAELAEIREQVFDAVGIVWDALKGRVFVGNNPQFDAGFLRAFLARGGRSDPWHYHLVDLKALVAAKKRAAPPWSTAEIAEWSGVPLPEDAHTARADCEWNRDVYKSLHLLPKECEQL